MKYVKASTPILRANHHKTKETIKTNKKRYKQGKVIAKGILYVRQTQRVRMKDNQENKELNEKSRHTKEYLRKSSRVDEENKKFSYWKKKIFLCKLCLIFTDLTGTL